MSEKLDLTKVSNSDLTKENIRRLIDAIIIKYPKTEEFKKFDKEDQDIFLNRMDKPTRAILTLNLMKAFNDKRENLWDVLIDEQVNKVIYLCKEVIAGRKGLGINNGYSMDTFKIRR